MSDSHVRKNAADLYKESTEFQFAVPEIPLGPWTSYSLMHDPKHLAFVLGRYKFVAKMLQGRERVMEVGSGDGFGVPLVANAVKQLFTVDWDQRLLDSNARRLKHLTNVTYVLADLNTQSPDLQVDAAYWVDVLEHLDAATESAVIENIVRCLPEDGVLITGTPNRTASQYASPQSEVAHINLKTMDELRALMQKYFRNVFMFGMNDEVLHTGYAPMCHYIWSLAVGVRRRGER
jgi:2-polyprenyl-3-methyl-5-hydroxy-6-metoxy-1,4-benzoquinol methylase